MYALWSDPDVCRYSGEVLDYEGNLIPTPVSGSVFSDKIIDFWERAAQDGWGFRWAVMLRRATNEFAGTVGFNSLTDPSEIAYHLLPSFWGKGYMAEACRAAIDWRMRLGPTGIEAFIEPDNERSTTMARRLGLTETAEKSGTALRFLGA